MHHESSVSVHTAYILYIIKAQRNITIYAGPYFPNNFWVIISEQFLLSYAPKSFLLKYTQKKRALCHFADSELFMKEGGFLLSRIALQYHRRKWA